MEKRTTAIAFEDRAWSVNRRSGEHPAEFLAFALPVWAPAHIAAERSIDAQDAVESPAPRSTRLRATWVKVDRLGLVCHWIRDE
ncbi:hypothetical protein [Paraburkholderia solisilvae]|uniref:Uncharacterized protein n=1 Tax=Paraburkholderia solisilvae TaxID=624376 RepID=A0A6J5CXV2_9BURK|nr:hypothetical protein [Paraburkholderia solisilvae]CAB3745971.1 hypothetical protein LMG29739_00069 [Paraburkholderia solisilvae]